KVGSLSDNRDCCPVQNLDTAFFVCRHRTAILRQDFDVGLRGLTNGFKSFFRGVTPDGATDKRGHHGAPASVFLLLDLHTEDVRPHNRESITQNKVESLWTGVDQLLRGV